MFNNFKNKNKLKTHFRLFGVNGAGFTVLEMIVVITIIVVLITVTVPGLYQFKLNLSLSRVAYKFEQDLRRMQGVSLSQPSFKDQMSNLHLVDGYGVYVDLSDNKKYIIYGDHNPGNHQYDGSNSDCQGGLDCLVETVDFSMAEPGIIIKEINNVAGSNVSINFNPPSPTTTITPTALQNEVDVVFAIASDPTKTKTVSINTAGLIEVK